MPRPPVHSGARPVRGAAGRLLTGPVAFGLAGALDLLLIVLMLLRYGWMRRYHGGRDAR